MSTKYKFQNHKTGVYFVSFAVVYWIDVFIRDVYKNELIASMKYCQEHKGLILYAWVIMPSHVHLIFGTEDEKHSDFLRDFKKYTTKKIIEAIKNNPEESRREWMLWMMAQAGKSNSNVTHYQFWQQSNHPIEIWSKAVVEQKLHYLHHNPVVSGFVHEPEHWLYSSALDYAGGKGLVDINLIV